MKARGVDEKALSDVDLKDWIGAIDGEEENVREVVEKLKNRHLFLKMYLFMAL